MMTVELDVRWELQGEWDGGGGGGANWFTVSNSLSGYDALLCSVPFCSVHGGTVYAFDGATRLVGPLPLSALVSVLPVT